MKIAIAQIGSYAGNLAVTAEHMERCSHVAAQQGADLVVFPMAALTGPLPVSFAEQDGFLVDVAETLVSLADRLECPAIVPVVSDMEGDPLPEAMFLRGGEVMPLKFAAYLSSAGWGKGAQASGGDASWASGLPLGAEPAEAADAPAPDLPVLEVAGAKFGVAFTYEDLDDYVDFDFGVDGVIFISGYGYALDDPSSALGGDLADNRYVADARDGNMWIVGVGSVGGYGTQVYTGSSFVLSPRGMLMASAPAFDEAIITAKIDPHARVSLARPLVPEVYNAPLYLWETLVLGLHDYLDKQNLFDVVLGLDGSLASMLLATLASDALGPTHVHAVVRPDVTQGEGDAIAELVRNLRIEARWPRMDEFVPLALRGKADGRVVGDLVDVNLAAWARELGGIVIGSADKTGLALEADPNGSHAAAIHPFGDVYRTDLLSLAQMRLTISPVIPESACEAYGIPAIEGLAAVSPAPDAQVAFVDSVLRSHLEWEHGVSKVVQEQGHADVVARILDRLAEGELARTGRVMYLMVSSKTLFDARRPLGMAWRDRVRSSEEVASEDELAEALLKLGEGLGAGQGDSSDIGREVRDMLGYLRDFGSQPGERGVPGGQGMPGEWQSPFSEN